MNTFEKVAETLADRKGCAVSEITAETAFSDLALDSLDIAELVMELEDTFDVSIEITADMKTVKDLVGAIEAAE